MGGENMEFVTLVQIQERYGISKATALNWIRLGKLRTTGQKPLKVYQKDIEQYQKDQGRLRNRRNKQTREDFAVPQKYLEDQLSTKAAIDIIQKLEKHNGIKHKQEKTLLLIIYKLLYQRGLIPNIEEVIQCVDNLNPKIKEVLQVGFGDFEFSQQDGCFIKEIVDSEIPNSNADFLGLMYLALKEQGHKNKKGSYYTPQYVVKELIGELTREYTDIPKTLDPTCGSGAFLMEQYVRMIEKFGENKKEEILSNLYGYDTDPMAITLCKVNLLLLSRSFTVDGIKVTNTLKLTNHGEFDLLVGNPPWGYKFKEKELKELWSGKYSMDSFAMFLLKGMELLKEAGVLCYCLPYSFLNVKSHQHVRRQLIDSYRIISVKDLGKPFDGVFTSSISICIKKETQGDYTLKLVNSTKQINIKKKNICATPQYNICFVDSELTYDIISKINSVEGFTLAKKATFGLGIVTGNNAHYIKKAPIQQGEPIIKGNDIYKYVINHGDNHMVFEPEMFQQVAPVSIYRAKEKLIYRFINKSLMFAYDNSGSLTLNSANVVIPKIDGYHIKYIMAVLNSRVIQFYYQNVFPGIKVLRHHIEAMPIPYVAKAQQTKIINKVDEIMVCKDTEKSKRLYEEIDEMIFEIYNLKNNYIEIIKSEVVLANIK